MNTNWLWRWWQTVKMRKIGNLTLCNGDSVSTGMLNTKICLLLHSEAKVLNLRHLLQVLLRWLLIKQQECVKVRGNLILRSRKYSLTLTHKFYNPSFFWWFLLFPLFPPRSAYSYSRFALSKKIDCLNWKDRGRWSNLGWWELVCPAAHWGWNEATNWVLTNYTLTCTYYSNMKTVNCRGSKGNRMQSVHPPICLHRVMCLV